MGQPKPHQRGQRVATPATPLQAPERPTPASKLLMLHALIEQYTEARKAVNATTSEGATARAEVAATRAYRAVAAHFIDQLGIDKSTYAHLQPTPKDLKALCAHMGSTTAASSHQNVMVRWCIAQLKKTTSVKSSAGLWHILMRQNHPAKTLNDNYY